MFHTLPIECVVPCVHLLHLLFEDVQTSIQVRIDHGAVMAPEQAAVHTTAHVFLVLPAFLVVKEAALAGIALLRADSSYACHPAFVAEHADEHIEGNLAEILVRPLSHIRVLFPSFAVTDDHRVDLAGNEMIHEISGRFVHVIQDAVVSSQIHRTDADGHVLPVFLPGFRLRFRYRLVRSLIDRFQVLPVNEDGS